MLYCLLLALLYVHYAYACGSTTKNGDGTVTPGKYSWPGACGATTTGTQPRPVFPGQNNRGGSGSWRDLLGGNTGEGAMTTRGPGSDVTRIQELTCNSMNEPNCIWHNTQDSTVKWRKGTGRPSQTKLRSYTGTSVPPVDPYAFAYPSSNNPSGVARLVSDPISCQRGDGELSFAYWTTRNIELKACTRPRGGSSQSFCTQPVLFNGAPGPAYLNIPAPSSQPFEVYIQATNFDTNEDFAIVDDIEYNAILC